MKITPINRVMWGLSISTLILKTDIPIFKIVVKAMNCIAVGKYIHLCYRNSLRLRVGQYSDKARLDN
jgi:hypothetical protein